MAKLYAIGVGPGDPELLTRKAERILRQVDVVLAPASNPDEASLALETVRPFLDQTRQEILIHHFPMTADHSKLLPVWKSAATRVAGWIRDGRDVAFITIGDPLFYSTFIYLLRVLRESRPEIQIEIVPGISSLNAAASESLAPLADGNDRVAIIPATAGMGKVREALADYDTIVLLKVKPAFNDILELIRGAGLEQGTLFVERVGGARQKVLSDFKQISEHKPDYLSLMIIRPSLKTPL